jgi:zinc D-Ala-D-Ala dipeptidase
MYDKSINRFRILLILAVIFSTQIIAQPAALDVTTRHKNYKKQVAINRLKRMVELKTIVPNVRYELRYAGLNNFMHERLYKKGGRTFLRLPVAEALVQVQRELNEKGLGLKIWDAYRPYSVTVKMWEPIKDERYVADPAKGSGHNRGTAVDLTVINLDDGSELNMGTDFDNFSDTAHHSFTNLPAGILKNRTLLKTTMEKYGFIALPTEWWHYYWNKASDFELMDIDFKKFKN